MIIISEHKEHYKIEDISKHIKAADTLLDFPKEFKNFDIVIGNPPYISNNTLTKEYPEVHQALKESKEYTTLIGKWDLSVGFFEKGLNILKPNGMLCYINTKTYTDSAYGKKLRAMLLENTIHKYNDHTGEKLFNADVNTCSIFIQKTKPTTNHKIQINNKYEIKQSTVTEKGFYFDENTIKCQQIEIKAETNTFNEICYIGFGMKLGSKKSGEFEQKDLISETQDELHPLEYIEGKDMNPYQIKRIRYLEQSERVPAKIESKRFPELFTAPEKIITNSLGKIKSTYDDRQLMTNQNVGNCVLWKDLEGIENRSIGNVENREKLEEISKNYNPKYIVAILNSPVGKFLLRQIRGKRTTITATDLNKIKIAKANKETQNKIVKQVNIMMNKEASNNTKVTAEATINKTIYEIYQLTEEEINIIEGNLK